MQYLNEISTTGRMELAQHQNDSLQPLLFPYFSPFSCFRIQPLLFTPTHGFSLMLWKCTSFRVSSTLSNSHSFSSSDKRSFLIKSISERRQIFEALGKKIGVNQLEDWYNVDAKRIAEFDSGNSLDLTKNHTNFCNGLQSSYPNFTWQMWKVCAMLSSSKNL